jgi:hypothetical protein
MIFHIDYFVSDGSYRTCHSSPTTTNSSRPAPDSPPAPMVHIGPQPTAAELSLTAYKELVSVIYQTHKQQQS